MLGNRGGGWRGRKRRSLQSLAHLPLAKCGQCRQAGHACAGGASRFARIWGSPAGAVLLHPTMCQAWQATALTLRHTSDGTARFFDKQQARYHALLALDPTLR